MLPGEGGLREKKNKPGICKHGSSFLSSRKSAHRLLHTRRLVGLWIGDWNLIIFYYNPNNCPVNGELSILKKCLPEVCWFHHFGTSKDHIARKRGSGWRLFDVTWNKGTQKIQPCLLSLMLPSKKNSPQNLATVWEDVTQRGFFLFLYKASSLVNLKKLNQKSAWKKFHAQEQNCKSKLPTRGGDQVGGSAGAVVLLIGGRSCTQPLQPCLCSGQGIAHKGDKRIPVWEST